MNPKLNEIKGYALAIFSGATFGLIPLFAIPVIADGMDYTDMIFYRFLFGSAGMLLLLLSRQVSLRVSLRDLCNISILSIQYVICAITLFMSYKYIPSGVSTSLIYTNPIWCALITLCFLGGKLSLRLTISLLMSVIGVAMLCGMCSGEGERILEQGFFHADTVTGLALGMWSGIGYGIYLTILPRLHLSKMPATKLNFYIFFVSTVMLAAYALCFDNGISLPHCSDCWWRLLMLGIIPTAISNICLTMSLHLIESTVVSVLGAMEPFTAMVVGILWLGEPFDAFTITGAILILSAVTILTRRKG